MEDPVARIITQWARERPDLDVSAMGVIGRISRLAEELGSRLHPVFAHHGLGEGEFDVLATLRRSGTPYTLTPSELAATTMVTSGAATKRIDRLAAKGLVRRSPSDTDGRGRVVTLTPAGLELVERAVEQHVANEERLLAGLTEQERTTLAALLTKMLTSLDEH